MSKNTLDSILSQYEKNTDNNGSKPKISNEERLKNILLKNFKRELETQLKYLGYYLVKTVILLLMKPIFTKDKLMVNMKKFIVQN